VLRDVMQHAMHFIRGATREQAFVIATQQHFISRVRHRRQQFGAILRASQALDQGDDNNRNDRGATRVAVGRASSGM
jgi:hypothetical protein